MSIGLAFVQGLVGGFQKNIEREQTARAADDQRLAGLQDMLFQGTIEAAKAGKPVPKFLGEKLKQAKTQVANRPSIGPFGTGIADRLDIDLTGLAGDINSVSSFGRVYGTPETFQLGFNAKDVYDEKNTRQFISEAVSLTRNDQGLNRLRSLKKLNPTAYDEFVSAIQSSSALLVEKAQLANPNKDKRYQIKVRNVKREDHPLFGIDKIYEIQAGETDEVAKKGSVDFTRNTIISAEMARLKRKGEPVPTFMTLVDTGDATDQRVSLFLKDKRDVEQAKFMASNFNITMGGNVFDYWHNKHVTLPGMKPEDKTRYFKYSLNVGKAIPNVQNLDPDKDLYRLLADEEAAFDVYEKIIKNTDNKSISKIYALSTYMTGPKKHLDIAPPPAGSMYSIVTNPYDKEEYAAMKYYGDDAQPSQNFASMKEKYLNVDTVTRNIGTLYNKVEQLNKDAPAPMIYQLFKNNLEAIFSLEEGVVGAFARDIVSFKNDDEDENRFNDKELTSGYLKELAYRGNSSRSEEVAQIQALRITLAFQMARAADPSGRLSNQDIEQQMAKLGGNLTTPTAMLGALRVTLREFEEQKQKLDLLIKFGQGSDPATDSDFKLIDAVIAHDALRENHMRFKNLGSDRTTSQGLLNPDATYLDNGNTVSRYQLSMDGKFYLDQVTLDRIPVDKFKKKI